MNLRRFKYMLRSLFSGVSGMKSNQAKMDVIGNNISNVNTTGFKSGRVTFKDMLSQTVQSANAPSQGRGGINPKQVGVGVTVAGIDTNMSQGALQPTSRATDMAIEGNGFFVISDGNETRYTRDGSFTLDKDGNLITADGYHVLGMVNSNIDTIPFKGSSSDNTDYKTLSSKGITDLKNIKLPLEAEITKSFYKLKQATLAGFNINFNEGNALKDFTIKTGTVADNTPTSVTVDATKKIIIINGDFVGTPVNSIKNFDPKATTLALNSISDADLGTDLKKQDYTISVKHTDYKITVDTTIPANINPAHTGSYTGTQDETNVIFTITADPVTTKITGATVSVNGGAAAPADVDAANGAIKYNGVVFTIPDGSDGKSFKADFTARYDEIQLKDASGNIGAVSPKVYPGTTSITIGDTSKNQTVKINANNLGDLTTGDAVLSIDQGYKNIIQSSDLEDEINYALKNAGIEQKATVTGLATSGITTTTPVKLALVSELKSPSVGGLTFKLEDNNANLNGWVFKTGEVSDGTPTSVNVNVASKTIIINGDFDKTTNSTVIVADDVANQINKEFKDLGVNQSVVVTGTADNTKTGTSEMVNITGKASVKLTSFGVETDGSIRAVYGDQTVKVGQVALASFQNSAGLTKMGGNTYTESLNSGNPVVGSAASQGYGNIQQGMLEMSNVDLASEFTDMIVTSRAFQANSRTIQTSDEMLQELLNLKR
jgi:flagellar hook protein FlgE